MTHAWVRPVENRPVDRDGGDGLSGATPVPADWLNYETILSADTRTRLWVAKWPPSRGATRLSPEPLRYLGLGIHHPGPQTGIHPPKVDNEQARPLRELRSLYLQDVGPTKRSTQHLGHKRRPSRPRG